MDQESQSTGLLYDFLYVDKERASSLLTQLYAPGIITSIKRTTADLDKSTKNGGVDIKVAKAGITFEEILTQTQEKTFDASWALPLNLLDKLSEDHYIKSGISGERLGNTVVVKGYIRFFDISFLKKSMPFMSKVLAGQSNNKSNKKVKAEDLPIAGADGMTFGMVSDLFDVVPNSLQVDFMDDHGNNIWMTISKDNFTINPDDMVLKYGGEIPGEWHVLGLIDAIPGDDGHSHKSANFPQNPLKDGLRDMLQGIRDLAGRPNGSYGMTPLLMFRKIT